MITEEEIKEKVETIKKSLDINPDFKIWNEKNSKEIEMFSDKNDNWKEKIRFIELKCLNEQIFYNYKNLDRIIKFQSARLKQRKKYVKENIHNFNKETLKSKTEVIIQLDQLLKFLKKIKKENFVKEVPDEIIKF
jgi:hypothetical protein